MSGTSNIAQIFVPLRFVLLCSTYSVLAKDKKIKIKKLYLKSLI